MCSVLSQRLYSDNNNNKQLIALTSLQGLLDRGEAETTAQLSRGAPFLPGTRRPVRGSRLRSRSQVSVQEQAADRPAHRMDATARELNNIITVLYTYVDEIDRDEQK